MDKPARINAIRQLAEEVDDLISDDSPVEVNEDLRKARGALEDAHATLEEA